MLKNVLEINKYKNRDKNSSDKHEEYQYLNLLSDLMENGTLEEGRKKRRRKKLEFVKMNNKNNNIIPTYLSYEILYHYFIGSISVYYNDVMYFMRIRFRRK